MDYTVGFWIVLVLFLIVILVMVIMAVVASFIIAEGTDALFRVKDMAVTHLDAKAIDVVVHLVYKRKARTSKLADHAAITRTLATVMNSPTFQSTAPWEAVAKDFGLQLWNDYDVIGLSVELFVPSVAVAGDVQTATYSRGYVTRVLKLDAL